MIKIKKYKKLKKNAGGRYLDIFLNSKSMSLNLKY